MLTVEEQRKAEEALYDGGLFFDWPVLGSIHVQLTKDGKEYQEINVSISGTDIALTQGECSGGAVDVILMSARQALQLNFYLNKALGDIR